MCALGSYFNLINTTTGFKVDLFIRKDRPFDQSVMSRRRGYVLPGVAEQPIQVVSPEDIILLKLEWYRLGDESSPQQWQDVLGVFQTQGPALDQAYLDAWAPELGVADLLARLRLQSAAEGGA